MVQKAVNSPALSRKSTNRDSPRQQRAGQPAPAPRQMSIVSDLDSVKSYPISIEAPSDVTCESGYETTTDVVCKGPLLYYKPRWFGESWKRYDAVLTNDGVFRWYKKGGSEPAELEGTLVLQSIPNGLITFGKNTENIPKEQQVRFPKEFNFQPAIAIGEPYTSGEIFWFLCPSTDMIRLWEQGFRDLVAAEKFSSGSGVYSAWKKYSPERPTQSTQEHEPHKEAGWNDAAIILALDFSM
ncbi:uncharacterized protein LOC129593587 isoform X2 [Paramacrobiotus metropolitanus]|nr:uncharacterized protein LOC129593587 isoform X2 [Paramacrobiotus metropolitanus]